VGVDGSEGSCAALRWAVERAQQHCADVLAISAWTPPPPPVAPWLATFPWGSDVDPVKNATEMLDDTLKKVFPEGSEVKIQQQVTEGNEVGVLIEASRDADVVVGGARGYGGFHGLLLGSVGSNSPRMPSAVCS
jgi:nucleotide-binding universal stress UspA family protein